MSIVLYQGECWGIYGLKPLNYIDQYMSVSQTHPAYLYQSEKIQPKKFHDLGHRIRSL